MAKLSATARAQRVAQAEAVRKVRDRYAEALRLGYSKHDAAKLAQSNAPIKPMNSKPVASVSAPTSLQVKESRPVKKQVSLSGSGDREPKPEVKVFDIPPNWEDLPWPQLRELATSISGKAIRSRADAASAIEEHLQARR